MYEAYWNLSRKPFTYRVEPAALYRSTALQNALLRLRYCVTNNAGATLLLGTSGVGKSSLLQLIRAEDDNLSPFVHVIFPTLSPAELLWTVANDLLDARVQGETRPETLLNLIREDLRTQSEKECHPVIAFDEAHLLSQDALNEVVLPLLNLVDAAPELQLTVILAGQPVLGAHVARNAQLRERIAVTAAMDPFSDTETAEYIHLRMNEAGAQRQIFTDDAVEAIVKLSGGNPRRINRLCDMALLVCYADQTSRVTAAEIESLSVELLPAAA